MVLDWLEGVVSVLGWGTRAQVRDKFPLTDNRKCQRVRGMRSNLRGRRKELWAGRLQAQCGRRTSEGPLAHQIHPGLIAEALGSFEMPPFRRGEVWSAMKALECIEWQLNTGLRLFKRAAQANQKTNQPITRFSENQLT